MLELKNISRNYQVGEVIHALDGVSLTVKQGDFIAITGPSGCGKSTLLNILGLLDTPDSGAYLIDSQPVEKLKSRQRAQMRNKKFGFVFQSFNLLPRTSAFDNVRLPLQYRGEKMAREKIVNALTEVGLSDRVQSRPNQLSGGQQQRVAVARALVGDPEIILADEPTGNLDTKTGTAIMELFKKINERGKTIVMVTHNDELLPYANRIIKMRDGKIVEDKKQ